MDTLPEFDAATGMLPPGRYVADLEAIRSGFVSGDRFARSATRSELWTEWEQHRVLVEAAAGSVSRLWLSGSFITDKTDPNDIDVTYWLSAPVYDGLSRDSIESLDDLTHASWCAQYGMRVDSHVLRLPEDVPFRDLLPTTFNQVMDQAFRDIGLYDELWQRAKAAPGKSPEAKQRRGYVEVVL